VEDASRAVGAAAAAFEKWPHPVEERWNLIRRIPSILQERKHEFSAMMVLEESKSWAEADGDTAEAIDFCEFYARDMERLAQPQPLTPYPGERNELEFIPLGVCAVIPPWNFPLAILAGMTTAALVTGNTVVLKPSSDAPGIATMFLDAAEEAGIPPGVLNFLTGGGSTVGNALVENPKVRLVAFTGSRDVGVGISEEGGKGPARPALDQARGPGDGARTSSSWTRPRTSRRRRRRRRGRVRIPGTEVLACSRLIVHEDVHDDLLARVAEKTKALKVGDVRNPENAVGAVINERAQKKILDYVEVGRREGRIVAGGTPGPGEGFFVMPTVVDEIEPGDRLAREEIFGPVLAVLKVKDFDEGIAVANDRVARPAPLLATDA
jgi:1-pyrroline-5-carboxylate dehydrogenase